MRLSIVSGSAAVVWQLVCSIQPLFNVFFQNYLGATAAQLGLLVAIIQVTGVFQILSIFLNGWTGRQKPIYQIGHVIHRSMELVITFVAIWVARGGSNERGILIITVVMGVSWCVANSTSACWWGWVADIFPENIRGEFFMKRSAVIQIVNIIWFFIASTLLDIFPRESSLVVFAVIAAIGAIAGALDPLLQIPTPELLPDQKPEFDPKVVLEPLGKPDFIKYAVAIGLATFSMNLISPFQSPYVVDPKRIGAPNTWLGIMQMLTQFLWVLVAPFWGTVMDRWGRKPVVIAGTLLVVAWVGYLVLTPGNYFIVLPIIAVVAGLLSPAFWEGTNQMMLSLAPEKNRVSYVAWYLAIVGLVSAPGSLVGGILSDALAGVHIPFGPIVVTNFHIVQLLSIVLCCLCAVLIGRVREGSEKPFGFVMSQIANPQIFRTFQNLGTLGKSYSPKANAEVLRAFDGDSAQLALRDIIERLDDADASVREEATRALGRIPSPQSVDALILRLLDHDSDIRVQAAKSLGKIGDRKAVGALVGCLWEPNEELQKACVEALADIGDEESIQQVMRFLRENTTDRLKQISSQAAARLGVFEAAWEIFPSLLAAKTKTARRQYAISMADLLGKSGEFYPFVSGNASVLQSRQAKLLARFSQNMREVYARQKKDARFRENVVEKIGSALAEDRNDVALREMIALTRRLFADLFGAGVQNDFLCRYDQKLGIFAWMMEQSEAYLDAHSGAGLDAAAGDVADVARVVTLLSAYFLSEY